MPQYKLSYFDSRGMAEITRLLFAQGGIEYQDVRYTRDRWLEFKPSTPFGQMPVLEVDGVMIAQSGAVARLIAKRAGLAGETDLDQAMVDMFVDSLQDLSSNMTRMHTEKDENKKKEMGTKFISETFPTVAGNLEKLFSKNRNGDGFFVGESVTMADLLFFHYCDYLDMFHKDINPSYMDKYPKLKALRQRVAALPKIAEWVEKRPKTQF